MISVAEQKSQIPKQVAATLKRQASKYNARTAEVSRLRAELDEAVAAAREGGGTFREIAALAERSVAWVQGSLERSKGSN